MANCTNKRFLDMRHGYELGLLSDEARMEFELHLYECQDCFDSIQQFKEEAALIKHDPDLQKIVLQAAKMQSPGVTEDTPSEIAAPVQRPLWRSLVPTSLVAAAVLVLLILKPWQIEFHPTQEAIAAENRLAVMYFENLSDPDDSDRLGEIITNLLITDLSESHYVQIVSSQRLHDVLKMIDKPDSVKLDRDIATQVAIEAGARWMLLGSISENTSGTILTGQLVAVETGDVVASQHVADSVGADLFSLVDKLTIEVKNDLSLPAEALEEPDSPVADATTHSPEAYRYYLDGIEYANKFYTAEAIQSFRSAIALDTTFAMAYFRLAKLNVGQKQRLLTGMAVRYCDRVSNRERLFIKALEAATVGNDSLYSHLLTELVERYPDEKEALQALGNWEYNNLRMEDAIRHFERATELDPMDKSAFNSLAYVYGDAGDFASAITAINKYIDLAPDEPNPYDSRADLYASFGYIERAKESFRKALEIKPDNLVSLLKLGHMHVFSQDYSRADSCYKVCLTSDEKHFRSLARLYQSYIPIFQGKFVEALRVLDDGLVAEEAEQAAGAVDGDESEFRYLKALIYAEIGKLDLATKESALAVETYSRAYPDSKTGYKCGHGWLLARSGKNEEAEELFLALKPDLEARGSGLLSYYSGLGATRMVQGNLTNAIALLEKAATLTTTIRNFPGHSQLGQVYLQEGRISEAVRVFEQQLSVYTPGRIYQGIESVKLHYHLGRAYEESRWFDKAADQYEIFLDIWKDADSEIVEIDDARTRLTTLRNRS